MRLGLGVGEDGDEELGDGEHLEGLHILERVRHRVRVGDEKRVKVACALGLCIRMPHEGGEGPKGRVSNRGDGDGKKRRRKTET